MWYREELADVYDLVFTARGKDYDGEVDEVERQVRRVVPDATSLLDVGCGTGGHLERFRERFDHVEGIEPSPAMREVAVRKLPDVPIHDADMRDFGLARRFDAVCSMFGPIGYMQDESELTSAIAAMAGHLAAGGVLVLDPWWFPENFIDGYVIGDSATDGNRSVVRMSHSIRTGSSMQMTHKYLVGDGAGIREFCQVDTLSLFRREQYVEAFTSAGLDVEYLAGAATPRGLFVGRPVETFGERSAP